MNKRKLYFVCIGAMLICCGVDRCDLVFRGWNLSTKGDIFNLVYIEEFSVIKIKDEKSFIFHKAETFLLFFSYAVIESCIL
jgi:hypothetical protein